MQIESEELPWSLERAGGWDTRCSSSTDQDRAQLANTNIQSAGQTYSSLKEDFSLGQSPCDENTPSRKSNFLCLGFTFIKQPSDLNLIFDGFLTGREGANGIQSTKWLCVFFPYDPPMVFWRWVFCSKLFSLSGMIVFFPQQEYNPPEQRDWVNYHLLSTSYVLRTVQGSKAQWQLKYNLCVQWSLISWWSFTSWAAW